MPIKVVSDRLGHASSRITLYVYTASVRALDAEAVELAAGLFVSVRTVKFELSSSNAVTNP